jgi:GT2 family glycosyltransferase
MGVDVVVVHYQTPDLLRDFIESYEREKFPGCTLTVVDNDYDNIGYARACNKGAAEGSADVILLANADTVLYRLAECHDALLSNPEWGILGPRQVDANNRITAGGIFGTETSIGQRGWQEVDHGQYDQVEEAMSASGSLYFIKRHVWQELTDCSFMQEAFPGIEGAFIPTPHYYEETCCSYHARHHGYKCIFYGPVQMIHHWHASSGHGQWADQQTERSKAMMRQFLHGHGIQCE